MPQEGHWLLAGKSGASLGPRVAAPSTWVRPWPEHLQPPQGLLRTAGGLRLGAGGDPQPGLREGRRACPGIASVSEDGHCTPHSHTPVLLGSRCQLVTLLSF